MKAATIRTASTKTLYVISWDVSGGRFGNRIQNRTVSKTQFERFVAKHGLSVQTLPL